MAFWVSSHTTQAKLTAGDNVTITSTPSGDARISASGGGATGVTSIVAGTNTTISSTGAGGTGAVTVNAAAAPVQAINAGMGISVSSTTGTPTISNSGVTAINAGTGISSSAASGSITLSNSGVTSIIAGTNTSISSTGAGGTGAVTINAAPTSAYYSAVMSDLDTFITVASGVTSTLFLNASPILTGNILNWTFIPGAGEFRTSTLGTYQVTLSGYVRVNGSAYSNRLAATFPTSTGLNALTYFSTNSVTPNGTWVPFYFSATFVCTGANQSLQFRVIDSQTAGTSINFAGTSILINRVV